MPTEVNPESKLETAHVLFMDAVGYSKLLIHQQRALFDTLNQVVRSCEQFRSADAAGNPIVRLPTGDGMILVFTDSPEGPVLCASEISRAVRDFPGLDLRMGVHTGLISRVVDVNNQLNVTGAAVNIAQRVMSLGDPGHILLSKRTADDLMEYPRWQPFLHEIGECETKHGLKIALVNFYNAEVGNPTLPNRCKEFASPISSKIKRTRALIPAVAVGLLASAAGYYAITHYADWKKPTLIPEKSIAVLPFENLSDDKQNVYFADGVQDQILSDLAKVADLTVISRTSVLQYRTSAPRNIREIAKRLGVAHILEGTVQKVAERVVVSAQLIDAINDKHIWAERYERDVTDVFAIEDELAKKIVSQLKSKLSAEEKTAIEERPTSNLAAYDLYVRAKFLIENAVFNEPKEPSLVEAIDLLQKAVTHDPSFLLAYCQLAHAHDQMYLLEFDHTQARLDLANAAIGAVERLKPDSGEAHLARAKHLYGGYRDYERERQELLAARRTIPNNPLLFLLTGYIERRQGRWDEAAQNMERARELDPENSFTLQQIALTYELLRRYSDTAAILDRAVALAPSDVAIRVQRADIDADWRADTKPLYTVIQNILGNQPEAIHRVAEEWLRLAFWERDSTAAEQALSMLGADGCHRDAPFPRAWCEGRVALLRGDLAAATEAFSRARKEIDAVIRQQPNYPQALCAAAMIDAALGKKTDAIREGTLAVKLLPVTKDSVDGALMLQHLAAVYAWVGEKDLAFEQLQTATTSPGYLSYGSLRLDPLWDPLRNDPRFEKIIAPLAPK